MGLGVVGLACARELSRRGLRVVGLEASTVGHAGGSSTGDARMRVPTAFPDDGYLRAGLRSGEVWRELQAETGKTLMVDTGCLSYGEGAEAMAAALADHDVPHEALAPADAERRHGVSLQEDAVFQPDAQTILADRALRALAASAAAAGADLREGAPVTDVAAGEDGAEAMTAGGERVRAGHAVVATGRWINETLAPFDIALDVAVTTQTYAWYDVGPDAPRVGLVEYGVPDPYGLWTPTGRKAAFHAPGADLAGVDAWVQARFGGARRLGTATCSYTSTPDERFVVEAHGSLVAVSACSGHGFQDAPDTAWQVADVITRTTTKGPT